MEIPVYTSQIANDNGTINNCESQINNLYDQPLKYFFDIEIVKNNKLNLMYSVINYIINKDNLKTRFNGSNSKYEELAKVASKVTVDKESCRMVSKNYLDDGYKSIISCIVNIASLFECKLGHEGEYLVYRESNNIIARIKSFVFNIEFLNINTYQEYLSAMKEADKIKNDIATYIYCAQAHGNFLQFSDVYVKPLENAPFVEREVKFRVSPDIIPRLIQPLYGENPECGLREIIQNSSDACKQVVSKGIEGYKPSVKILLDKDEVNNDVWRLVVRDNGIGMNESTLVEKYFVIGESTKKGAEENLVGQFGIGALATFLLGDIMEVKTKSINGDNILGFTYRLSENNKFESENVEVKKIIDDTFEFGTEVSIKLKDNIKDIEINKLEETLKIHKWYLLSDIPISYFVNGKAREITSLDKIKYDWEKIIDEQGLLVEYIKNKNISNDAVGKVIYNGMLIPNEYNIDSSYIKFKPCVNIIEHSKGNSQKIKPDLSRSEIQKEGQAVFVNKLKVSIYNNSKNNMIKKSNEILDTDGTIKEFYYNDVFLKDIPLFFCRDGFGVYSIDTIEKLKKSSDYHTIIKVFRCFASNNSVNIEMLNEGCIYVFDNCDLQKSYVSYLIEQVGSTIIPADLLKSYFYYAKNSNGGFRKETIKCIYSNFNIKLPVEDTAKAIWDYHNNKKSKLFYGRFWNAKDITLSLNNEVENNSNDLDYIKSIYKSSVIKVLKLTDLWYRDANEEIVKDNIDIGIIR
ncbi:hypothetical protein DVW05_06180 [Clostridium botulinum]|uniref:ATP-binding protein n=1 Tax=Clostridium sp. ZBS18 TaxID=2949967 RepID=UPI001DE89D46|nr:ATP-binding protein [Clostridium sp. ZBS18]MBN1054936.1 hypothetical protein [Clostridium botulinum]